MRKIILFLTVVIGLLSSCVANEGIEVLTPQDFMAQMQSDSTAVVLDVRTPAEYAEGHLKGALLINYLDSTAFDKGVRELDKTHACYIYCKGGKRSRGAVQKMRKLGFRVYDMKGGILNWQQQGLPVTK